MRSLPRHFAVNHKYFCQKEMMTADCLTVHKGGISFFLLSQTKNTRSDGLKILKLEKLYLAHQLQELAMCIVRKSFKYLPALNLI